MRQFFVILILSLMAQGPMEVGAQSPSAGQWVKELAVMDIDRELTGALGTDRVSKWLVRTAQPGVDRLNMTRLERVAGFVAGTSAGMVAIRQGWEAGDPRLARLVSKLLGLMNLSGDVAQNMLLAWRDEEGAKKMEAALRGAIALPDGKNALARYVLETPQEYPALVAGLSSQAKPGNYLWKIARERLAGVVNSAVMEAAEKGERNARLQIAEAAEVWLDARGAYARHLIRLGGGNASFADLVWAQWLVEVGSDPVLTTEWLRRPPNNRELWAELMGTIAGQMRRSGSELLTNYARASRSKGGRYATIMTALYGPDYRLGTVPRGGQLMERGLDAWAGNVARDQKWGAYLLWHLTRPAGALGRATMSAVTETMTKDSALAALAADAVANADGAILERAEASGAETAEFRAARFSGRLTQEDWRKYGKVLGQALEKDEVLQKGLLGGDGIASRRFVARALAVAVPEDGQATRAWVLAMMQVDPGLRDDFMQFCVSQKLVADYREAQQWLEKVAAATERPYEASVVLGQFKNWWGKWLGGEEAPEAVKVRLAVELWGVPGELRMLLVQGWADQAAQYMEWRKRLRWLPSPGGGSIRTSTEILARRPDFLRVIGEAAYRGDPEISDILEPVWRKVWSHRNNMIVRETQRQFMEARGDDVYIAGALAMVDAIGKKPAETEALLKRAGYEGDLAEHRRKLILDLLESADRAAPAVRVLLNDEDLWKAWSQSLFSATIFAGAGRYLVPMVEQNPELREVWDRTLVEHLVEQPAVLGMVMRRLALQRAGELAYRQQLRDWETELMRADALNAVLWEQLIADPTGGWVALLEKRLQAAGAGELMRLYRRQVQTPKAAGTG
jgi:hypothetical protein